jgi:formylglycine-generating enzyme required for sulfatase activity
MTPFPSAPALVFLLCLVPVGLPASAQGTTAPSDKLSVYPAAPAGPPPLLAHPDAQARDASEMKRYVESIPGSSARFSMIPVPGGRFTMGGLASENGFKRDEAPRREVSVSPFWIEEHEVTWDEYHVFMLKLDLQARAGDPTQKVAQDDWADAVSRPTPPYVPMDFDMGVSGSPAICMTHFAARQYTQWLTSKTGRFYRLPTEAEWEFAARAGSTTAFSFGDEVEALGEHAWFFDNSDGKYHPIKQKKPNRFGLYDLHGNVAEWVLDRFDKAGYPAASELLVDPIAWWDGEYAHVVRGGSWDDDADRCRSAARRGSTKNWKIQDPQLPQSIWYFTDARFVGFRVVRPLTPPPASEWPRYFDPPSPAIAEILQRQRTGGR